jgi:MoaA/NifB/PqqE/SkfB family radical SAM enzyme
MPKSKPRPTSTLKKQLAIRGSLLAEVPSVAAGCLLSNVVKRFRPLAPTVLQLNVNARCNARCGMCNIWRTEDKTMLSLEELERAFADPLFSTIEYTIVAGGEPTLRHDLPEVVELMIARMPRLRKVSIPTTGIATELVVRYTAAIAKACLARNVVLSLGISLDGTGDVYERVRGVKGGYPKVLKTLIALKELSKDIEFSFGIGTTISNLNAHDLDNLVALSRDLELGINFAVAALADSYFNNLDLADNVVFSPEAKAIVRRFLTKQISESPLISEAPFYYRKALEMLEGARRSMPCSFQDQGLVIDASGDVHYCINSRSIGNLHSRSASEIYYDPANLAFRRQVIEDVCPSCQVSCFVGVGLRKTVFPFLRFTAAEGSRRLIARARTNRAGRARARAEPVGLVKSVDSEP